MVRRAILIFGLLGLLLVLPALLWVELRKPPPRPFDAPELGLSLEIPGGWRPARSSHPSGVLALEREPCALAPYLRRFRDDLCDHTVLVEVSPGAGQGPPPLGPPWPDSETKALLGGEPARRHRVPRCAAAPCTGCEVVEVVRGERLYRVVLISTHRRWDLPDFERLVASIRFRPAD